MDSVSRLTATVGQVRALGVNLAKGTIYSGSHCGTIAEFDWNKAWEQTATVPCECEVSPLRVPCESPVSPLCVP